jgi:hypothetical protein
MNNVQEALNFRKPVMDSFCRRRAYVADANEGNAPMVVELIAALCVSQVGQL